MNNSIEAKLSKSQKEKEKEKEARLSKKLPRKGFCRTVRSSIHHRAQFSPKKNIYLPYENLCKIVLNQSLLNHKLQTTKEIAEEVFLSNVAVHTSKSSVSENYNCPIKTYENHNESNLTKNKLHKKKKKEKKKKERKQTPALKEYPRKGFCAAFHSS